MALGKDPAFSGQSKMTELFLIFLSDQNFNSDQIALSMDARAFGSGNKNKFVKPASMTPGVLAVVLVEAAVIVLMMVAVGAWGFGIM